VTKVKYLQQSIKNFQEMGSIVRSGPQMCKKMTHDIPKNKDIVILELGAGDGAITDYILHRMSEKSLLIVFEINSEMVETLNRKYSDQKERLIIINDGAQKLETHLEKLNISQVDMIISAIPFIALPEEIMHAVLKVSKKVLKIKGIFIQMHYTLQLKHIYKTLFGNISTSFVALNIPPGYVFKCIKEE
jgi:phospholipid N-methyltransferase